MIVTRTLMGIISTTIMQETCKISSSRWVDQIRQYSSQPNHNVSVDREKGELTIEGKPFIIKDLSDVIKLVEYLKDPLIWDKEAYVEQSDNKLTLAGEIPTSGEPILKKPFNFPFGLWFRGEKRIYERPLLPSLFREDEYYDESSMFAEFVAKNSLEYGNSHFSTFEWLTLMQHYGLPTRLLDWTENILTATYFSTRGGEEPSVLYILNAIRLNNLSKLCGIQTPDLIENHEKCNFLKAVTSDRLLPHESRGVTKSSLKINFSETNPSHFLGNPHILPLEKEVALDPEISRTNFSQDDAKKQVCLTPHESCLPIGVLAKKLSERIRAQFGVFTLHGGKRVWEFDKEQPNTIDAKYLLDPLLKIPNIGKIIYSKGQLTDCSEIKPVLIKVLIDQNRKSRIRQQLSWLGIDDASVFPELEHKSAALKNRWTIKLPYKLP